jgi:hypothetical protein
MPGDHNAFGAQRVPSKVWNVILKALALGAFAFAMVVVPYPSEEKAPGMAQKLKPES